MQDIVGRYPFHKYWRILGELRNSWETRSLETLLQLKELKVSYINIPRDNAGPDSGSGEVNPVTKHAQTLYTLCKQALSAKEIVAL